jgi:hypothetical protein
MMGGLTDVELIELIKRKEVDNRTLESYVDQVWACCSFPDILSSVFMNELFFSFCFTFTSKLTNNYFV